MFAPVLPRDVSLDLLDRGRLMPETVDELRLRPGPALVTLLGRCYSRLTVGEYLGRVRRRNAAQEERLELQEEH